MNNLVIRGVRGTTPSPEPTTARYGGHTTCFSLSTDEGHLVIDAGTGLVSLGDRIQAEGDRRPVTILLTHLHLDHVLGLPSFAPLYIPGQPVTMMADPRRDEDWKAALRRLMATPYWPVGTHELPSALAFKDLPAGSAQLDIYGIRVAWHPVPHPQQCLCYRLQAPAGTTVIATDAEYDADTPDPALVAFCRQADTLIFDAHYTPEEYPAHAGWGHSAWPAATAVADAAGVGRLLLTHHAPRRTDAEINAIVGMARQRFAATDAARDGQRL
jgi:phosphoribosyl 1,2-cyclic phosphodiesterase